MLNFSSKAACSCYIVIQSSNESKLNAQVIDENVAIG